MGVAGEFRYTGVILVLISVMNLNMEIYRFSFDFLSWLIMIYSLRLITE